MKKQRVKKAKPMKGGRKMLAVRVPMSIWNFITDYCAKNSASRALVVTKWLEEKKDLLSDDKCVDTLHGCVNLSTHQTENKGE
jgi:hypothetical protein